MDERTPPSLPPARSESGVGGVLPPPLDPYHWTDEMAVHSAAKVLGALKPEDADIAFEEIKHRERLHGVLNQRTVMERLKNDQGFDVKTGLLNENKFLESIEARVVAKPDLLWGLVYIDLKDFKWINDNHPGGHARGDEVLEEVATLLHLSSRHQDFLMRRSDEADGRNAARLHGDEFVVFVDLTPPPEEQAADNNRRLVATTPQGRLASVCERLERIGNAYADAHPDLPHIAFTIGSALGEAGLPPAEVLKLADQDMQRHKREQQKVSGSYRTNPA
jgi:diguanylate cyclase (GGDEF)-like protein